MVKYLCFFGEIEPGHSHNLCEMGQEDCEMAKIRCWTMSRHALVGEVGSLEDRTSR